MSKIEVEVEDRIDPNSWTTKELVKHLYREIQDIHTNQQKMIETIEKLERKDMEKRAVNKTLIAVGTAIGTVAGFLIKMVTGI